MTQHDTKIVEVMAAQEHEQWMGWAKSLVQFVPEEKRREWESFFVPYSELPENIKALDRPHALAALDALTEAGYAIHDTRTHVAVPTEPTKEMEKAAVKALVPAWLEAGSEDTACMEALTAYRAMLAAAEGEK